ncbi:MAG: S-formylglutathione hydrolase [Sphingomonadaceae bacterium]|nr:S-formylglutathione hydrolase [Sphingomonadaceae bacterium]
MSALETISENRAFGGTQGVYSHRSSATGTDMKFAVYVPPHDTDATLPVLWYLSGLTCTHANVMEKGEYRAACAEHGIIFVAPDTSPRGDGVPDDEAYDLGQGAGFYIDAERKPWSTHYRMETYVARELPELLAKHFPLDMKRQGITGHSMGGHGALTLALRRPGNYKSVSAFAPIVAPSKVPWGQKAFLNYLGTNEEIWHNHDAYSMIFIGRGVPELLIDVGDADQFLDEQLKPEILKGVCLEAGIDLKLRIQPGYDHSYYFISTFMAEHIAWHAERLKA